MLSNRSISPIILLLALLTSCAKDPNKEKITYLNSGNEYLRARKYQEAVIQFRRAIQVDAKFAAGHDQLGRAYLALGNLEAAFREFNTAVILDPANSQARLSLSTLQLGRRQYADAQSTVQRVLTADPNNAQAHAILGEKYLVTGNLPGAVAEFEKAIELDAHAVGNYATLGTVYMAARRPSDAERTYKRGAEANPKSVDAHTALGEFYFSQRRLAEAEAEIRAGCDLEPSAVAPRLLLGRTLVAEGRLPEAGKAYTLLKSAAPGDPRAYQALGIFYSNTGQKEKALAEFQGLAAAKPADGAVKAWLIETLIDLNRIGEAAPLVRAAVGTTHAKSSNGGDPRILLSYGRVLIAEGKYPEALAALQKVTASEPKSARGYYYLGIAQKAAGSLSLAKDSFARALELSPEMSQAGAALANLDVKDGSREDALKQADHAIGSNPGLALGYVAKGRALIAKGDKLNGAAALEEALHHDPVNLAALAAVLNLSISQGKTAETVQRINGLLQRNPGNAGLCFLLALGEFSLKDLDKAAAAAKQAIALDPKTPQVWTLMANIDFSSGRPEKAKSDLRNAIAASPRTISNYTVLGKQYESEKNWAEAKSLFEKAHDIDHDSPFVAAELAFLYLEHGGDVNIALSLAQLAKQEMPNSPAMADALGWAYYKLGSADLAVKELEESVHMTPANPVYQYHLGMAYASARRWDKAARSLRAALKDDSNFPYAASAKSALDQIGQQAR